MDLRTLKVLRFFHLINKKKYNEKRQIEIVKASPLFDAKWYLEQNPDVKAKKIGAARHYVKYGWKEGRNPSKEFDTKAYLEQYPELVEKNWCPLFHYMLEHKELLEKALAKIKEKEKSAAQTKQNDDYNLIAKSKYFDKRWYLKMYPDVKKAGVNPVEHYLKHGWKEGRNPGPKFDGNVYLDLNADVKRAKINPLLHYEKHGKKEGRKFQNQKCSSAIYKLAQFIRTFKNKKVKKIVLFSHELTYTGAPLSLLKAAECLKNQGYQIVIISLKDGLLATEFKKIGKVIISANLNKSCLIASFCDFAIINTITLYNEYNALKNLIPTVWWIREPVRLLEDNNSMRLSFMNADNIYTMSEFSRDEYLPYNSKVKIIKHGIKDYYHHVHMKTDKFIFAVIGTIGKRKGQDVFIEAVKLINRKMKEKCEFHILGYPYDKKFYSNLIEKVHKEAHIEFIKPIDDFDSMIRYYENISCAVVPSREEPTSRVALEAMMMGRPAIVSDHVGAKYVLKEGENGYTFPSENAQELALCIEKMVNNLENHPEQIEKSCREAYLRNNSIKAYSDALSHMIRSVIQTNKSNDYNLINNSECFDKDWYLKTYPDVKKVGIDPVKHYMQFGWKEGRNPGPKFNTKAYLIKYSDVKHANINPLLHYEKKGKYEGRKIFSSIKDYSFYERLPISEYKKELALWFKEKTGKKLNLNNPQTYNEKIQWLKLYDSTPIKTRLADKYLVRDWIKEKIGEQYLIPLLGVYDSFDEIDFDKLPKQFVIKCNHGSGYNIIVPDKSKLDLVEAKQKVDKWMKENFAFKAGFELQYRDMTPKIIIEKYIENQNAQDLYDYKFWCFNGKVKYIQFLSERKNGLKMAFYNTKWEKQNFVYNYPLDTKDIIKPDNLHDMILLAEKLSKGFYHVRIDFYRLDDGTIYFGEYTFTSMSGICKWNLNSINSDLGKFIKLPKLAYDMDRKVYCKPEECYKPNKIDVKSILARPVIPDDRNLKLTIVVPIYNALSDVKNCLTSLLEANLLKQTKVILMDDCSNKETQNYLQKFANKHSNFKLCRNNQNFGFIKNCNKGIDLAKGDIVVLLNSDTKVPLGFDKRVLQCFKSDKNIALASPLSIYSGFFKIPENKKYRLPQIDKIVQKTSENKYPLITPEGFCYALRKEVTDKIGKLDEIFGMGYCEEDDLDMRALLQGYRTVLIDNLIVYHKSHASFSSEKREEILKRNRIIFRRRWGNQQAEVRKDMKVWDTVENLNKKINELIAK